MGALSFAMDALTSLTNVVLPGSPDSKPNALSIKDLYVPMESSSNQAIKEFTSGMSMLRKHATSLSTDSTLIAKQNLQLLNNNLKTNKHYKKLIADIKSKSMDTNTWGWIPIVEQEDITAGFLYVRPGNAVSPNSRGGSVTMREESLIDPFAQPDGSKQQYYHMYLNQFGSVTIESEIKTSSREMRLKKLNTEHRQTRMKTLRQGDAYVEDFHQARIKRLGCSGESCLLLSVHLPAS